jgi:type 1 fimbria pilin
MGGGILSNKLRKKPMKSLFATIFGAMLALALSAGSAAAARVTITGEVIDSWCYLTEIMYPLGTAHRQCALWCAAGGIPAAIVDDDGQVYIILKIETDSVNVANPTILDLQTNRITVEGDTFERDGITYLTIARVIENEGIVNLTADKYGIQPFGE